jgi:hypothetical protein
VERNREEAQWNRVPVQLAGMTALRQGVPALTARVTVERARAGFAGTSLWLALPALADFPRRGVNEGAPSTSANPDLQPITKRHRCSRVEARPATETNQI